MAHPARFRLSIANGGTDSPALSAQISKGNARSTLGNSQMMTVYVPAALTGVCTVQVDPKYGSGAWKTLQENGTDITLAAGKAVDILGVACEDVRIHSAGAEGAQRDFDLVLQIAMD